MHKKFQKNIEDFVCEKCGFEMTGDGFTNHCSQCLWSKHVDNNPGDRACICMGLMKPIEIFGSPSNDVLHVCEVCGIKKKNKLSKNDDFEKVLEIAKNRN